MLKGTFMINNLAIQTSKKQRDPLVDIIKAIGIISIVIGHSAAISIPNIKFNSTIFVYGYHLMIFMFVLGFLFKKENATPPFQHIGKTVYSLGTLYVSYSVVFVLLHNLLIKWGFISGIEFNFSLLLQKLLASFVFYCDEMMLGAFWFVPMYAFLAILFASLFYVAEKSKCPVVFHSVFIALTATIGILIHLRNISILFHIQTSVIAIPICYLGFFTRKYWNKIEKFFTWYGAIIASVILNLSLTKFGAVELSANQISTHYLFYPITVVGIYLCLSLARTISKFKIPKKIFSYIGKNSFHIMALHLVSIKIVDVIYGILTNQPLEIYVKFPFAFDLWYIYYPVGVFLPLGIIEFVKLLKKFSIIGTKKLFAIMPKPKSDNV